MNLYYAFGGGLGHLTRAAAFIYSLGFHQDQFIIISSSEYAEIVFKKHQIIKISEDYYSKPFELRFLIEKYIKELHIDNFYIDSFPVGIAGELNGLRTKGCKINYIARYLKWNNYYPYIESALYFDNTFIVDFLAIEQLAFVNETSKNIRHLNLREPPTKNYNFVEKILAKLTGNIWLIAHCGNLNEIKTLYSHSKEIAGLLKNTPKYLIISQLENIAIDSGVQYLKYFPASDFFPFVDRIFTACGYNTMRQTLQYSNKHICIPFERRFDDQYMRARQRQNITKTYS